MDDWRSAINAMENGQFPKDPVEQRGNSNNKKQGGGGKKKPSRFEQNTNQNNQPRRFDRKPAGEDDQQRRNQQYVGMSQTEVYKSLKKPNYSQDDAMPNINDEMGMIDELNDEFNTYKRIQDNYRNNPIMNESGMGAGGSIDYGAGNKNDRGMGGNQGGSMMKDDRWATRNQGNVNEQMNKAPSSRYDSDQRMINESMNAGVRGDGQDRYSPSKMFDLNEQKYSGGGSDKSEEQLLVQLKGMLGGNLMNASPEIMRLIQEKEEELKRKNQGNMFDSQRSNQDRAVGQMSQSSRVSASDRGAGNSWQQSFPEEDQALSNAMFNDPSSLRSMDSRMDSMGGMMGNKSIGMINNESMMAMAGSMMGMESSSMGLMGLDINSSNYQTSFMENQFSGPNGRRTLLGDTPMDQGSMNERYNSNFGAGSSRGGAGGGGGIWDNQSNNERRSNMPDLKDELRSDLNYRFKSGLKSLGARKEETILNFDWKCFHPTDFDRINPKFLRCFDCDIKVRDSESFIRHITGMKHKGKMSDIEKNSNFLLKEYRHQIKEFEDNKSNNGAKEMGSCALCECKVVAPIKTHRAQNHHKALKGYVHPFCKLCAKEFDGRPEFEVHKFHPEHISHNERENIHMPFTLMGDEDFMAALKELKKDNELARSKAKQKREGGRSGEGSSDRSKDRSRDRSKDRSRDSGRKESVRERKDRNRREGDIKKREDDKKKREGDVKKKVVNKDDDIVEVHVVDKKPEKVEEKKSLMECVEMGNLNEYNSSKGVGRDFLRPVTGFFCRACKKLLPTEEESVAHMKSKLHWDACVKADKSKAQKRPAPDTPKSENPTPAKKAALSIKNEADAEEEAPEDPSPIDDPAAADTKSDAETKSEVETKSTDDTKSTADEKSAEDTSSSGEKADEKSA